MALQLPTPDADGATHLTFADWLSGVVTRWRTVAWSIAATFVVGALAVLIVSAKYEAEGSFVINGASGKGALGGAAGGLASLAGQFGIGGGDASESPPFYKELLTSRELLTRLLLTRFPDPRTDTPSDSAPLIELLNVRRAAPRRRMELAIKKLKRNLVPETNVKTALVRVAGTTRWPELSAQMTNKAMALVNDFNLQQRASRARDKRKYLEGRLDSARAVLRDAEARRRAFLSGNRKIDFSPALQFSDEQLKRDIDVARDEFQTLRKDVETARLDEFNDVSLITVVDSAVPPGKAVWPQYPWLVAGCLLVGLIVGVTIAGSASVYEAWARRNPASAARLAAAFGATRDDIARRRTRRARRAAGA